MEKTLEMEFPFIPRSPDMLRNDVWEMVYDYIKGEGTSDSKAKKESSTLIKKLQNDVQKANFFLLWDAMGVADKDLELQCVYSLAMQCWKCRAVPPDVKCNPDSEAEELLSYTINNGLDKKMHHAFIEGRQG
jgi:hypothetical protein